MPEPVDISAWIALFMGLYSLGASIGELRSPGFWKSMLDGFENNAALQFLTGIVCIAVGGAIYVALDWNRADWLEILVKVMGGGMVIEGFFMLAFGQQFMRFAGSIVGNVGRIWAMFSALIGIALIVIALLRL